MNKIVHSYTQENLERWILSCTMKESVDTPGGQSTGGHTETLRYFTESCKTGILSFVRSYQKECREMLTFFASISAYT